MKYVIKAPVENYNGISAGVQFKDGKGETDSERAAEWFRGKGYAVEAVKKAMPVSYTHLDVYKRQATGYCRRIRSPPYPP